MPTITAHSRPGNGQPHNEDWYIATSDVVLVLDGATIRTDTGCIHGLPWYVHQLGSALLVSAQDRATALPDVIAAAVRQVTALHADTCDLQHPGTPSAAIGIARRNSDQLEWAVLGDITVLVDTTAGLQVTVDNRVSQTALDERRACDLHEIGTDAKMEAILAMKDIELASRNVDGGYWIASVNPDAAAHAYTGSAPLDTVRRIAVCSDGAMRALNLTSITTHAGVLAVLESGGPEMLIDQVRTAENHDPTGRRRPRNKATDDATAVVVEFDRPTPATVTDAQRHAAIDDVVVRMSSPNLHGAVPTRTGQSFT